MKILLDTHVFLWAILEPHRLSPAMTRHLLSPAHEFYLSAVSIWEIGAKYALGKLPLALSPELLIPQQIELQRLLVLPLNLQHALLAHRLPLHHCDPFDRMLIAQAQFEHLSIMTSDRQFASYHLPTLIK